jgi:hypothetical protein
MRCYNAAVSDHDLSIEEVIARLIKLEGDRDDLLAENSRQRLGLLRILARKEKPADPPPKPA